MSTEKKDDLKKPSAKKDVPDSEKTTKKASARKESTGAGGKAAKKATLERDREEQTAANQEPCATPEGEARKERELSEEELRKTIEEQLEKITVKDVVIQMMLSLSSMGYQRLGFPESVNLKYRDLDQARLAIDALQGLLKAAEGKVPESELAPYRSTLANLQMNFVRLQGAKG